MIGSCDGDNVINFDDESKQWHL